MPLPPEPLSCHLCGSDDPRNEISVRAVAWDEPRLGDDPLAGPVLFASVPRCRDSQLCRERCEVAGDRWPVTDRTYPTRQEPIIEEEAPKEVPPWL